MKEIILVALIAFLIGTVFGEHKTCLEVNGDYSWDFGTCKVAR